MLQLLRLLAVGSHVDVVHVGATLKDVLHMKLLGEIKSLRDHNMLVDRANRKYWLSQAAAQQPVCTMVFSTFQVIVLLKLTVPFKSRSGLLLDLDLIYF
jgi:hypothetical protein